MRRQSLILGVLLVGCGGEPGLDETCEVRPGETLQSCLGDDVCHQAQLGTAQAPTNLSDQLEAVGWSEEEPTDGVTVHRCTLDGDTWIRVARQEAGVTESSYYQRWNVSLGAWRTTGGDARFCGGCSSIQHRGPALCDCVWTELTWGEAP